MKQPLLYSALIAGAFSIFYFTSTPAPVAQSADYAPRQDAAPSAEGMQDVMLALRGDIETGEHNEAGLIILEQRARQHAEAQEANRSSAALYWNAMGPDNIGGRTRAIIAVTENLLYTGGVSGGLYKSQNGGDNWTRVSSFSNAMVASIGVAENGDLYVGTGSHFDGGSGTGGSGFRGRGVYWSTDGESWNIIEDTDPGMFSGGTWSSCDALVGDPNNSSRVWWGSDAGVGYFENGVLFEDVFTEDLPGSYWVADLHMAVDGSYMLVAAGNGRVYRTSDFQNLELVSGNTSNGLLPQSGIGRARVAISQDDTNSAFALFSTSGGGFGGLYNSSNGGVTWTNIWPSGVEGVTPLPRNQGNYDLALGVGPDNIAYVGGIELWRCGPDYQAEPAAVAYDFLGGDFDVHADIHEIMFTPAGMMYIATDGGIYRSDDGDAYTECNRGYRVTQFYGMAHGPHTAVLGGTQDNGSLLIPANGFFINNLDAIDVKGGDGFDCAISQNTAADGLAYFATSQNGSLGRGLLSEDSEFSFAQQFYDGCLINALNDEGEIGGFYTCMNLYENFQDPQSDQYVILVNPYDETVEDSTFHMETANLNFPFDYTIDAPLHYWDELIRPEIISDEEITENEYWWLDPQEENLVFDCYNDTLIVEMDTTVVVVCDTSWVYSADTIMDVHEQLLVNDPYTTMTVIGFSGSQGLWMTRGALNFNAQPRWFNLGSAPGGSGAKSIEFAVGPEPEAGNHIFVSGWDGKLYRYSGLDNLYGETSCDVAEEISRTTILSAGTVVTGVAVDPNDANHVVATVGGYGTVSGGKVQETFNALSDDPDWDNLWFSSSNELSKMPVYDAIIDAGDATGQTILVGTEYGVWQTTDGGENWTMENLGMVAESGDFAAPVMSMEQQWRTATTWSEPSNGGAIYAGTHGRGIFRSDNYLSTEEITQAVQAPKTLTVYPNPVSGQDAWLEMKGWNAPSVVAFDIQGREVFRLAEVVPGVQRVQLGTASLPAGTYLVVVTEGERREAARLVIQ